MTDVQIRKIVTYLDETLIEGGRLAARAHRLGAVAAVIRNPWAGQGFVEDLQPAILEHAQALGDALIPRLVDLMGGAESIEAYGKAAVVGLKGEIEHAAGLIHTLYFGNAFRIAAEGDAYLPFINKRAGAGCAISFPLTVKSDAKKGARSHFLTVDFSIADAPAEDEIVVAIGAADSGRPHARIGDRYKDMEAMGVDHTGAPLKK